MNQTFVTCEDDLPPLFGVRNFYATFTAVPLMLVPLDAVLAAANARRQCGKSDTTRRRPREGSGELLVWTFMLLGLFGTNLAQHTLGPTWNYLHELQAAAQGVGNALLLNTLRRRDGYRALPSTLARGLAVVALGALVLAATKPTDLPWLHDAACGGTALLTGPFIVYTMGMMSYGDRRAWTLFKCSCLGLVLVQLVVAVEPSVCRHTMIARWYHSLLDHSTVALLFGSVARNAVHLTRRDEGPKLKEG